MTILLPEEVISDERRTLTQVVTADIKQVNHYLAKKGSKLGDHYHKETTEYFMVLHGHGTLETRNIDSPIKTIREIHPYDIFKVVPGEFHTIGCESDIEMMTFLTKAYTKEESDIWKE